MNAGSLVAGLRCLMVGDVDTTACDLQAYLVDAGMQTVVVPDIEAVRARFPALDSGLWVWIVNTKADAPVPLDTLRAIARTHPAVDSRFVVIGRGPNRYPQQFEVDRVSLDGNVLTRGALLRAVAIAAGRAQYESDNPEPARSQPLPAALSREEARRQGRLILVVEDNDMNQKVIMQQIALLGLTADLAGDGLQALLRWRCRDYALVLTDLHMPGMDGYQLAAAIRSEESERVNVQQRAGQSVDPRVRIIALTANALKSEADRCKAAGMDDYMSKPIPLADLQTLLDRWLPKATGSMVPASVEAASDAIDPGSEMVATLDIRVLRRLIGDDPRFIVEFLQAFRVSATRLARDIEQAYRDGNAARTVAAVHKLKSAARSVGAMPLGDLCADMEQVGSAGQLDALAMAFEQFKAEMAKVDTCLAQILPRDAQEGPP